MIKTLADFLEGLKVKNLELIKRYEIVNHPVLIGDMYEGLTKDMLSRAIFEHLDIRIVGGKIKNSKGDLSGEIDCMIVEGEGDPIPFTDKLIYHFSQVIAVIQVKKSLYYDSLDDSYINLKSVIEVARQPEKDGERYMMEQTRNAYRMIMRKEMPLREDLPRLNDREISLYHSLMMETYYPIRIVLGYFGYKSEYGLREAFARLLESKSKSQNVRGYGAVSLPTMIISGKCSIIKNNGMPFGQPFTDDDFYWPLLMTVPDNPIYYLLEIIWTRLSYKYELPPSIFGDDFEYETMHRFIDTRFVKKGNFQGWMYKYSPFTAKVLNATSKTKKPWEPQFVTERQYATLLQLGKYEAIDIKPGSSYERWLTENGEDFNAFITSMIETGLVYVQDNELRMLVDQCAMVVFPDGRFCAAENRSGEFDQWFAKYLVEKNTGSTLK